MSQNTISVAQDEHNMRLDRWFKLHYPAINYSYLQKLLRSGQIRIDSKRAKFDSKIQEGQIIRVPPNLKALSQTTIKSDLKDLAFLQKITLYEDDDILVLNKPIGLAVQGGSGVTRHVDGMLESIRNKKGVKPRLVHRLDRDTTGVLVIAKSRKAASFLADIFKTRQAQKIYWSLVVGAPRKREDKISSWLIKQATDQGDIMKICASKQAEAVHAISYYKVIEQVGQKFAWLEMKPHTGRTHQLRVHAAHIKHPILGDPKYFYADSNWSFPNGLQNKLHLHARQIILPHPNGTMLDVKAPLSPHMQQSFKILGFDANSYKD